MFVISAEGLGQCVFSASVQKSNVWLKFQSWLNFKILVFMMKTNVYPFLTFLLLACIISRPLFPLLYSFQSLPSPPLSPRSASTEFPLKKKQQKTKNSNFPRISTKHDLTYFHIMAEWGNPIGVKGSHTQTRVRGTVLPLLGVPQEHQATHLCYMQRT